MKLSVFLSVAAVADVPFANEQLRKLGDGLMLMFR